MADDSAFIERSSQPALLASASKTNARVLSSASLTFASRAFAKLAQLAFLIVAGRLLSLRDFASYSYVVSLATTFSFVSETGLALVSSRRVASGKDSAGLLYWSGLPAVGATALVASAVLIVVGLVDSGPGSTVVPILVAAAFLLANKVLDYNATLLRGLGRFRLEALLQGGGALGFVLVAGVLAGTGASVTAILVALCLKELISSAVAYRALRPEIGPPARPEVGRAVGLLKVGFQLALATTALALVSRIPLIVLGNVESAREVAWFSAALRFADATVVLATTAGYALLPGVAFIASTDPPRARRLMQRVVSGSLAVGGVGAVVAVLTADFSVSLLFGTKFAPAAPYAQVLFAGLPLYAVFGVCWYGSFALEGERRLVPLATASVFVSLALSVVGVSAAGAKGAAWAYVGAMACLTAASAWVLWNRLRALDS